MSDQPSKDDFQQMFVGKSLLRCRLGDPVYRDHSSVTAEMWEELAGSCFDLLGGGQLKNYETGKTPLRKRANEIFGETDAKTIIFDLVKAYSAMFDAKVRKERVEVGTQFSHIKDQYQREYLIDEAMEISYLTHELERFEKMDDETIRHPGVSMCRMELNWAKDRINKLDRTHDAVNDRQDAGRGK